MAQVSVECLREAVESIPFTFKSFILRETDASPVTYQVQVETRRIHIYKRDPLSQEKCLLRTTSLPLWPISAAIWTPKQHPQWPLYLSNSIIACLTEDAQVVLLAINTETYETVTVGVVDLLVEPEVREVFVSGSMMSSQMGSPSTGVPACRRSALKWIDLSQESSLLLAEILPGLFVGLRICLGRKSRGRAEDDRLVSFMETLLLPSSSGLPASLGDGGSKVTGGLSGETELPSDDENSQSSLTSSMGDAPIQNDEPTEHAAEVVELLQTCECHSMLVPEDVETSLAAVEAKRRRHGLHVISESAVRHLVSPLSVSLEHSFLLDYFEDCSSQEQARLHRRRKNRRVPSWEVRVSAEGRCLDLLILEGAASQVMTIDALEASRLVRLILVYVAGSGWLCRTESVWPCLPWDAIKVTRLQTLEAMDNSNDYSPLSSTEILQPESTGHTNDFSLTNAVWIVSPRSIHLIHLNDRTEDSAILLHPDLHNLTEMKPVKSSLLAVCTGELVNLKTMRGSKTGRLVGIYPCSGNLLLTGPVSKLTPATFVLDFDVEECMQTTFTNCHARRPKLLLKVEQESPLHTPSIRLSIVSPLLMEEGTSATGGTIMLSPTILDSEAAFIHAGSPMQDSLESSPVASDVEDLDIDFLTSIDRHHTKLFRLEGAIHSLPEMPTPSRILRDACTVHHVASSPEVSSVEFLMLEDVSGGMSDTQHVDLVACHTCLPLQVTSVREASEVVTLWQFPLSNASSLIVTSCDSLDARPLGATRLYKCPADLDDEEGMLDTLFDECAIEETADILDTENFTLDCGLFSSTVHRCSFFVQVTPNAIILARMDSLGGQLSLIDTCDFVPPTADMTQMLAGPLATQARIVSLGTSGILVRVAFENNSVRRWSVRCARGSGDPLIEECLSEKSEVIGCLDDGSVLCLEDLEFEPWKTSGPPSMFASASEVEPSETLAVMESHSEADLVHRLSTIYREMCRKLAQKVETRRAMKTSGDRQAEREVGRMGGMVDVDLLVTTSAQDDSELEETGRYVKCLVLRSNGHLTGVYLMAPFMCHTLTDVCAHTLATLSPAEAADALLAQSDSFTPSDLEKLQHSDAPSTADAVTTASIADGLTRQSAKLLAAHLIFNTSGRVVLMLIIADCRPLFYVRHAPTQPFVYTSPFHWRALPNVDRIDKHWRVQSFDSSIVSGDCAFVQTDAKMTFVVVWDVSRGLSVHPLSLTLSPLVSGGALNQKTQAMSIIPLHSIGCFMAVHEAGYVDVCTLTSSIHDLQHLSSAALRWRLINGLIECRARIDDHSADRQACQAFTFADAMRGAAGPTYLGMISRQRQSSRSLLMDLLVGKQRVTLDSRVGDVVGQIKRAAAFWQTPDQEAPEIHYWQYRAELRGAEMPDPVIIDLQPLEVALCMATSHVGALTIIAVGTAFTHFGLAPARGRLILGILGPSGSIELETLSSYYVAGAVTAMGAFRPPSNKNQIDGYPDRHLFYFSGGCRLYLQELVIDEARKVAVTGGSFYECRATITRVQSIKSYFVITTVDGVEFVMFRLSPQKATTTFLPVSLQGLGASMQKKGLPLCGAACQPLVKQTQLGLLTGDFHGNLLLFDFLPGKATNTSPLIDTLDSVKNKAPMLRLLDSVRLAQSRWLRILPLSSGSALQRAICLSADGSVWKAELETESQRERTERSEIFAARHKMVKNQFLRPRGNPSFGWDDLEPGSIHEAWDRAPLFYI